MTINSLRKTPAKYRPPQATAFIATEYVSPFIQALRNLGHTNEAHFRVLESMQDKTSPVFTDINHIRSVLGDIIREVNNPRLSFEFGRLLTLDQHGFFGYYLKSCGSLEEAIRFEEAYFPARTNAVYVKLNYPHPELFSYTILSSDEAFLNPFFLEALLTCIQTVLKQIFNVPIDATVSLSYDKPEYFHLYEEYLDFRFEFNQPVNRIVAKREYLNHKNPLFDPVLKELSLDQCDQVVKSQQQNSAYDRVREYVQSSLSDKPSVASAAKYMNMSERTLKRRLAGQGSGFRVILDEVRISTACDLLNNTRYPLEEISYRVGYQHVSTFIQAFKRVMQLTPTEYRTRQ